MFARGKMAGLTDRRYTWNKRLKVSFTL